MFAMSGHPYILSPQHKSAGDESFQRGTAAKTAKVQTIPMYGPKLCHPNSPSHLDPKKTRRSPTLHSHRFEQNPADNLTAFTGIFFPFFPSQTRKKS